MPPYLDGSIAAFAKIDMPAFVRLMDSFTSFNVTDRLGEITCPTLIVVGDEDLIKGPKYASFMAERIPNSEYVVVPGSGGMPFAWKNLLNSIVCCWGGSPSSTASGCNIGNLPVLKLECYKKIKEKKMKKSLLTVIAILLIASMALAACKTEPAPTVEPTEPEVVEETVEVVDEPEATEEVVEETVEVPEGLTCAEPVKIGLITDLTGVLQSYGAWMVRSFMLGMEYATGAPGSAGDVFDFAATQENTFKVDNCEIIVYVRDDASNPEMTTTVANELIDVQKVNFLVGTASSGATAVLQGIALAAKVPPLIVAPAAANDITGVNFNEYTFRTSRNNYQDAINECVALTQNHSTFIQLAVDHSFGHGSAEAFRDACTQLGAEFVADDIFAPATTTDFTPPIWNRSLLPAPKPTSLPGLARASFPWFRLLLIKA